MVTWYKLLIEELNNGDEKWGEVVFSTLRYLSAQII
jgi:hypothetical protein